MEHIAYNQEVTALLAACDLPVVDLRVNGDVCFFGLPRRRSFRRDMD